MAQSHDLAFHASNLLYIRDEIKRTTRISHVSHQRRSVQPHHQSKPKTKPSNNIIITLLLATRDPKFSFAQLGRQRTDTDTESDHEDIESAWPSSGHWMYIGERILRSTSLWPHQAKQPLYGTPFHCRKAFSVDTTTRYPKTSIDQKGAFDCGRR